jgi:hypothetical protein
MKNLLLASVAIVACSTPLFAAEPGKTVGQASSSGASSFYLGQDTVTMNCEVINVRPAVGGGGTIEVIGSAHPTLASAEAALKADKSCK